MQPALKLDLNDALWHQQFACVVVRALCKR
jgi:hypothetical protein